jgi:nicotinamide riboside kinase
MKNVLILGDCQSNGNNCLADEITEVVVPRTFSLRFHNQIVAGTRWALQQKDFSRCNISELKNEVWRFIRKKEMSMAWPSFLNANVINMSFNGAHYLGHCYRLKQYIKTNNKPDLVIITDYEFNHMAYSVTSDYKKYFFESLTRSNYSEDIEQKRQEKIKYVLSKERHWHTKLHRRSFRKLTNILDNNKIPYLTLRFGQFSKRNQTVFDSFLGCDIDCKDMRLCYTIDDIQSEYGAELSVKKFAAQKEIAACVNKFLNGP